jgi:hypothetical protein
MPTNHTMPARFVPLQLLAPVVKDILRGTAPRPDHRLGDLAGRSRRRVRTADQGAAALIRIDAMWLAIEPVDMRAGADRLLARVVAGLRRRTSAPRLWLRQLRAARG